MSWHVPEVIIDLWIENSKIYVLGNIIIIEFTFTTFMSISENKT